MRVLHAVIGLQILPPRGADEGHYQNVDERMQVTFQWLWTGEHKAADAPFSPDRIGRISLRKILNEPTHVCGMYLPRSTSVTFVWTWPGPHPSTVS